MFHDVRGWLFWSTPSLQGPLTTPRASRGEGAVLCTQQCSQHNNSAHRGSFRLQGSVNHSFTLMLKEGFGYETHLFVLTRSTLLKRNSKASSTLSLTFFLFQCSDFIFTLKKKKFKTITFSKSSRLKPVQSKKKKKNSFESLRGFVFKESVSCTPGWS